MIYIPLAKSIFTTVLSEFVELSNFIAVPLFAEYAPTAKLLGGSSYKVVEPVLPPDILGIYVLLPDIK